MPGMMSSPGVAVAVVASAGACFGAAYAGGTLTRDAAPAHTQQRARAAAAVPLPAPRVTALGPAAQIPELQVPVAPRRKATSRRTRPAVRRVVVAAVPARRAPALVVVPRAPVTPPATPVSRPAPTASPPAPAPAPKATPKVQKPAGAKNGPSAAITFFDDGGG
jgi:hypothetical protein